MVYNQMMRKKANDPHQRLQDAIVHLNTSKGMLARVLGLSHSSNITNWIRRKNKIPLEYALAIAELTEQYVTVHELRPDFIVPSEVKNRWEKLTNS